MSVRKAVLCIESAGRPCWHIQQRQSQALLPLGRQTVLQVLLDELIAAGADDICILLSREDQQVRHYVRALMSEGAISKCDDHDWTIPPQRVNVQCLTCEREPGLILARSFVGDDLFMYATTEMPIYHKRRSGSLLRRMCIALEATGADGVIAVREDTGPNPLRQTRVEAVGDPGASPHFVVANLVDPPLWQHPHSGDGLISRFVLSPIIFDYLEEQQEAPDEEHDLVDALRRLAHDREALWAVRVQGGECCFDLSSFLLYSRTFIHFSLEDPEVGTAVRDYIAGLALS